VPESSDADTAEAISSAESALRDWSRLPAIERDKSFRQIAEKIRHNVEPLARIITEERGKILRLARVDIASTADYLDYMAEWVRRIKGEILQSDRSGETVFLFRQPVGVGGMVRQTLEPPLKTEWLKPRGGGKNS
jgi:lactaldehyde dehydrogenase / glycolaldehyde dehydrogenase